MQTFRKSERLHSKKIIEKLFKTGMLLTAAPFRLLWVETILPTPSVPLQAAFFVPKKCFPNAVDRNSIKRRMREAYRKNKGTVYPLISRTGKQYAIIFVHTGKTPCTYHTAEEKINLTLQHFVNALKKSSPHAV